MGKIIIPYRPKYLAIGFALFFITVLSLLSLPVKIKACSPEGPDYWYLENLEISNAEIPDQIDISLLSGRNIEISNQSLKRYDVWLLTFEVQDYLIREGKYLDGEVVANHFNGESLPLHPHSSVILDLLDYSMFNPAQKDWPLNSINDFVYPDYHDLNIAADGLLAEPEPLVPQQLSLAFDVEDTLQIVPFAIHYSRNPNYDPQRARKGADACNQFNLTEDARVKLQNTTPESGNIPSTPNIQSSLTPVILTSTPVSESQILAPTESDGFSSLPSIRGALWLIPFILAVIFLRFRLKSR